MAASESPPRTASDIGTARPQLPAAGSLGDAAQPPDSEARARHAVGRWLPITNEGRPLSSREAWRGRLLFAAGALLSFPVAALPPYASDTRLTEAIWAAVLLAALLAIGAVATRVRLPAWCEALPALGFFVVAALLRDAAGGVQAGLAPLLVCLPIMWLALYHDRWLLLVGLLLANATLLGPVLFGDPARYPPSEWRRAVLMVAVAGAIGLSTQSLVRQLHERLRDLTAAEHRIRTQGEFTSAVLDTAATLIRVLDTEGRIVMVNRAWEQTTGFASDEVRGRRLWELAGPDEAGFAAGQLAAWLYQLRHVTGHPASRADVLYCRDGGRRVVCWTDTVLRDAAGRVTHVVSTGLDITEQRKTEQLLGHVLNAVTEQAVIGTDPQGVITVFNRGAERMLGLSAADVVGRQTTERFFLASEVSGRAAELNTAPAVRVVAAHAGPDRPQTREWTWVRADGTHLPVSLTVTEIHDDADRLIGHLHIARDISAERAAAAALREAYQREHASVQQLRELDTARSRFIAAASHDLRTPLTGVLTFAELLAEEPGLSPAHVELLNVVRRNADRLHRLTANLLTISQLDAGTLTLHRHNISLRDLVDAALDSMATTGIDSEVNIEVALPEPAPIVDVDANHIERVLTHLLSNAVKFTRAGGNVQITAHRHPDHVERRLSSVCVQPDLRGFHGRGDLA